MSWLTFNSKCLQSFYISINLSYLDQQHLYRNAIIISFQWERSWKNRTSDKFRKKIKYMKVPNKTMREYSNELESHSFQHVTCTCPRLSVNDSIHTEIKWWKYLAHRIFYGIIKYLKLQVFCKEMPNKPVLSYGSETRELSKIDERQLIIFRGVYGGICENEFWRRW